MICPRCRADGVTVEIGGRHNVLTLAQDRICPRCGSEYDAGPDGLPVFVRRRVWIPIFGWVTQEDFDEMLPRVTVRRGGIEYEYGAVADERRAVRNWGNGLRQGARPTVVLSLIRQWVTGSDDFRARAFR